MTINLQKFSKEIDKLVDQPSYSAFKNIAEEIYNSLIAASLKGKIKEIHTSHTIVTILSFLQSFCYDYTTSLSNHRLNIGLSLNEPLVIKKDEELIHGKQTLIINFL